MPLYPYRCTKCGHRFEKIQSFNAEPETNCPKCAGQLERLLTAPGLQFKGAGWYVNDYASKGSSAAEASSTPSGATETKSESKSAPADGTAKSSPAPSAPASAASTPKA